MINLLYLQFENKFETLPNQTSLHKSTYTLIEKIHAFYRKHVKTITSETF